MRVVFACTTVVKNRHTKFIKPKNNKNSIIKIKIKIKIVFSANSKMLFLP